MDAPEQISVLIVEDDEDDFIIARDLLDEQEYTPARSSGRRIPNRRCD